MRLRAHDWVGGRRPVLDLVGPVGVDLVVDGVLGPLDAEVDGRLGLLRRRVERVRPLDLADHAVDVLVALSSCPGPDVVTGGEPYDHAQTKSHADVLPPRNS